MLRATQSAGLWVQAVGRGLRKHPSKSDCLVLDFGDNAVRHGPIDRVEVTDRRRKDAKAEEAPGKACPNCHEVIAVQYRVCPVCDYEFPVSFAGRHNDRAGDAPILSEETEARERTVYGVRYAENVKQKPEGPSVTLRVEYVLNEFTRDVAREFLCFNHPIGTKGRRLAEEWWRLRSAAPVPATVMDALALIKKGALAETNAITMVREPGKQWPEIVGYDLGDTPVWDWPEEGDEDFFSIETAGIGAAGYGADDIPF